MKIFDGKKINKLCLLTDKNIFSTVLSFAHCASFLFVFFSSDLPPHSQRLFDSLNPTRGGDMVMSVEAEHG
jgi:hypothetical protein